MDIIRKVIAVPFDIEGNAIEGNFKDGIIGEASTLEDAVKLAASKGFELSPLGTPDRVPGELIDEEMDAFAVGVINP